LSDIQGFADALSAANLKPTSVNRRLSSIKSLFSFAHRIGYITYDVARPVRLPPMRNSLAERILTESEVTRMIALEVRPRNHALLLLLYASGVRVSEICGLRWRDLQTRDEGGQIAVFGKGGKTRHILLPQSVFGILTGLRGAADDDAPVFLSRKGRALDQSQAYRIVRAAARRAGVEKKVSPHFFRHAHASHALDRNAPISLVQQTLGHASVATTGKYLHAHPSDSSSRYLPI
jgi:integrase/recombinase XerD